jgi:hypothetical protein
MTAAFSLSLSLSLAPRPHDAHHSRKVRVFLLASRLTCCNGPLMGQVISVTKWGSSTAYRCASSPPCRFPLSWCPEEQHLRVESCIPSCLDPPLSFCKHSSSHKERLSFDSKHVYPPSLQAMCCASERVQSAFCGAQRRRSQ